MIDAAVPDEYLPPTQHLVMEVLGARYRLGEPAWTFPSACRPALRALAEKGWLGHKSGVIEATELAWLTDDGILAWLGEEYEPPLSKAVQWQCGFGTRTLLQRFHEAEKAHAPSLSTSSAADTEGEGR